MSSGGDDDNSSLLALLKDLQKLTTENTDNSADSTHKTGVAEGASAQEPAEQSSLPPAPLRVYCTSEDNYAPADWGAFTTRLRSFDVPRWSFRLSPVECALRGWTCSGTNTAACVTCGAMISGDNASTVEAHRTGCPWKACPCSKTAFLERSSEALQDEFLWNLECFFEEESNGGNCSKHYCFSPRMKERCLRSRTLRKIFDGCLERGCREKADTMLFGAASALFGWHFKEDDTSGRFCASCRFCGQMVSSKYFAVVNSEHQIYVNEEENREEGGCEKQDEYNEEEKEEKDSECGCNSSIDKGCEEVKEPECKKMKITDMIKSSEESVGHYSETESETEDEDNEEEMEENSLGPAEEEHCEADGEEQKMCYDDIERQIEEYEEGHIENECDNSEEDEEDEKDENEQEDEYDNDDDDDEEEEEEEYDYGVGGAMSVVGNGRTIFTSSLRFAGNSQAAPICLGSSSDEEDDGDDDVKNEKEEEEEEEEEDAPGKHSETESDEEHVLEEVSENSVESQNEVSIEIKVETGSDEDKTEAQHQEEEEEKEKENEQSHEQEEKQKQQSGNDQEQEQDKKSQENEDVGNEGNGEEQNEPKEKDKEEEEHMEHVEHKEMRELSEFEKAVERLCSEKCTGLDPEYDHRFFCMWTCHKGLCARSWYKSLCSSLLRSEAHSEEEFMNRIAEIVLKKAN